MKKTQCYLNLSLDGYLNGFITITAAFLLLIFASVVFLSFFIMYNINKIL